MPVKTLLPAAGPRCLLAGLALFFVAAPALAEPDGASGLPPLRQGLWELRGNESGRKLDARKCTRPDAQLNTENALMQKTGCRVSPVTRSQDGYSFRTECDLTTQKGRKLTSNRTSVIKVKGETAFELRVKGTTNGRPVDDLVIGRRVGDCSAQPAGSKGASR